MSNDIPIRVTTDVVSASSPTNAASQPVSSGTISLKERYPAVSETEKTSRLEKEEIASSEVIDAEKERIVSEYVQQAQTISRDLEFSIDKDLNKTIITVYDSETEKVIRKIPSEEALGLARAIKNNDGVLLRVKA